MPSLQLTIFGIACTMQNEEHEPYRLTGMREVAPASRLGGDLGRLREILAGPLAGLFAGVHVLPNYVPFDGADAGLDPARPHEGRSQARFVG
jgi:hypothetical protein